MLASLTVAATSSPAGPQEMKLEVVLVWGTDDAKSPNPKHKPVDDDLKAQIKKLPLKWRNYFEESRKNVQVGSTIQKVSLSAKCKVEIKNLGKNMVEVSLIGEGEPVVTRKQALPKGETFFLGGNAPNSTAWLVVIKRVE
jgi:hypothetical protein